MTPPPVAEAEAPTIQSRLDQLANECLDACDGDRSKAKALAEERVLGDRALYDALTRPLLGEALASLIRRCAATYRTALFRGHRHPTDSTAGLRAMAERSWYEFQLPGGQPLGDATRETCDEAERAWRTLANTNAMRANFMATVAKHLVIGKRVRDCLSEQQVAAIAAKEKAA